MNDKADFTQGSILKKLIAFMMPVLGALILQAAYGAVDLLVVGRFGSTSGLSAVSTGSQVLNLVTFVVTQFAMGITVLIARYLGEKRPEQIGSVIGGSAVVFTMIAVGLFIVMVGFAHPISVLMQAPKEAVELTSVYVRICGGGIFFIVAYNLLSAIFRGLGDSKSPLLFVFVACIVNVIGDMVLVAGFHMDAAGAAIATVISQYISGIGLMIYVYIRYPELRLKYEDTKFVKRTAYDIAILSGMTCLQQSVMNFGILMVQGIVNSFGTQIMAAFAVSVKIDTIAYMPVQDFGNAFSTFIAQNFGAGKYDRIKDGIKKALKSVVMFCIFISAIVFIFAKPLMMIFVNAESTEIINIGVQYLRIEGVCYIGIGILFMLYGYYRAINKPSMSVVLTVISLGIRVVLAYVLSRVIGVVGIWWSIPIGWFIADAVGICFYLFKFDR